MPEPHVPAPQSDAAEPESAGAATNRETDPDHGQTAIGYGPPSPAPNPAPSPAPAPASRTDVASAHPVVGDYRKPGGSVAGHVVALVAGVPVSLLMGALMMGALLDGRLPGMFTLLLGGSSTAGCVLAITGMCATPRRHRGAALALTLIPAGLIVAGFALIVFFVGVLLGYGNPN